MGKTIRNVPNRKYLRRPKTFSEHRDSEACRVDGFIKRKKRNKKQLPSAWEDQTIAALYETDYNPS